MDTDGAFDIVPWLKTDLISGFSDLLDDRISDADLQTSAATLNSADLGVNLAAAPCVDYSTDQASHTEWLKTFMAGVAPSQPESSLQPQTSDSEPFPGFPAAGTLTSIPVPMSENTSQPVSCSRMLDSSHFGTPNSWESSLSSYSLESSLVDLPSVPEAPEKSGHRLKSENSFACSFDSYNDSLGPESSKEDSAKAGKSRGKGETPVNVKASLADRNRERQQRFRQRQKAKIETLESQVVKLTAQTRTLTAEKEDLGGRAAKLSDLLQARDRALVGMNSQLSQLRNGAGGAPGVNPDSPQLTLTYCSPPLVLTNSQIQKMDGLDLAKLWKEYVWQLDQLLPNGSCCRGQWTPTRERLDALTSELVQLMMHLWDSCHDFARIKATGLIDESQKKAEETGNERWQQIAGLLTMDSEQLQCLSALRSSMRSRLQQIWVQRREAHTTMYTCLEDVLSSSRDVAVQHHKVKQSTEILKEGLKQENLLARDFEFAFYKKVLTPDQRAICMIRAYPFFPDSQALANWIAAKQGDQEAHNLMTTHSASSGTSYHSNA